MYGNKPLILLIVCLTIAGCRRARFQEIYFDMLAAEARMLEDRLYEVEYEYQRAADELAVCRARLAEQRRSVSPSRPEPELPALPEIELPPGFEGSLGKAPPHREVRPASHQSPAVLPEQARAPRPLSERVDGPVQRVDAPPLDEHVVAIWLNPEGTGPLDLDGRPGSDSLSVLIEPRNELDQYVPAAGELDLVLLDPSQQGEAARFARWEFDKTTARRMLATSRFQRGIHVRVPLPDLPSRVENLHLFVRYTGRDGQRVEADQRIDLAAAQRFAERWTPRAADSERPLGSSPPRPEASFTPRSPSPPSGSQVPSEPPEDFWRPNR